MSGALRTAKASLERPMPDSDVLRFVVIGEAEAKGSAKIVPLRRTFPFTVHSFRELLTSVAVTSDNKDIKAWQRTVGKAAAFVASAPLEGPVELEVAFYLPRPKSMAKRTTPAHITRPDTDKLLRAIGDALTGVAWVDDGQVTRIIATKAYAGVDEIPRAVVTVRPVVAVPPLFADERTQSDGQLS